jgi:hypothetical protein
MTPLKATNRLFFGLGYVLRPAFLIAFLAARAHIRKKKSSNERADSC